MSEFLDRHLDTQNDEVETLRRGLDFAVAQEILTEDMANECLWAYMQMLNADY